MNNTISTISVPLADCNVIHCEQCQQSIPVYSIPNSAPHLYCTKCTNVYHERREINYKSRFRFAPFRQKIMHHIEGNAPVCTCGGLFIFSALPRCPNCLHELPLLNNITQKKRLAYSDMLVFNGTNEFVDQGPTRLYQFTK